MSLSRFNNTPKNGISSANLLAAMPPRCNAEIQSTNSLVEGRLRNVGCSRNQ
jgi:hypothetical protein